MHKVDAQHKEAIVFGIRNNTHDTFVVTIKKQPTDPEYIDTYVQLVVEAQGYIQYHSMFESLNPKVHIFVSSKAPDKIGLWDITNETAVSNKDISSLKKELYENIDDKKVFILDKTPQGEYTLINKHTQKAVKPLSNGNIK